MAVHSGTVSLVGAGPGDPDLLTVKALRLIQSADCVFYDRLVGEEILKLIPSSTEAIYVGKAKSNHAIPQDQLQDALVRAAQEGKSVCRLKGGDPFVFGRGGEEVIALKNAGIQFQIVPGITAATGCGAYSGIPLTHRGVSQAVTMITAHAASDLTINWSALASMKHTLVFYMGLGECTNIQGELLRHHMSRRTPVAIIEQGTTNNQRTICGTLDQLALLPHWYQIQSPALIIVGEVAAFATEFQWFGQVLPGLNMELTA